MIEDERCHSPGEVEGLREEVERLREALATYADPGFYHAVAFFFDPPCGGFDQDFDEDHGDPFYDRPMPGKLARAALSTKEETDG